MRRKTWTEKDVEVLEECYSKFVPLKEISKILDRSTESINSKAEKLGLTKKYIKNNNVNFKAVYQNYNWCYERFINRNMTHKEIADECGASLRVIQKWCSEKYGLNDFTWRKHKKLTDIQRRLIMFSTLGDGHIDKRETQPLFIVSHAETQKDYLYWKYEILKDICNSEPTFYDGVEKMLNGNKYMCKPSYRLTTRIVDDLYKIRNMNTYQILDLLDGFGLSIFMLDDGYRGKTNWKLCMADYTCEEKNYFIKIVKEKFNLNCHMLKDDRYILFSAESSRIIDGIILNNIPNDLDIVKTKIVENKCRTRCGI